MIREEKVWSDEKACKVAEDVLDALRDGEWHSVRDLIAQVSPVKLEKVLEFYAEYDFVEWDRQAGKVRLDYLTVAFLRKLFQNSRAKWKKRSGKNR
jgi:hypothetical protein